MRIRLAARGSALSMAQAGIIARQLGALASTAGPVGVDVEILSLTTTGDRLSSAGAPITGKGVFTKEIDEALLDGRADVGVHSLKDLPSVLPDGLILACVPRREDPSDVLISRPRVPFAALPAAARVGTGSPRRRAQLLAARPDLCLSDARGNVDTRIRRLEEGRWDAIVLARAGLARLGRLEEICDTFSPDVLLPAIGQGALALIARRGDETILGALAGLDDAASHAESVAERRLLERLQGGCRAPMAGRAAVVLGRMTLTAAVYAADGSAELRETAEGPAEDPEGLGDRVADALLARGAAGLLSEARA